MMNEHIPNQKQRLEEIQSALKHMQFACEVLLRECDNQIEGPFESPHGLALQEAVTVYYDKAEYGSEKVFAHATLK